MEESLFWFPLWFDLWHAWWELHGDVPASYPEDDEADGWDLPDVPHGSHVDVSAGSRQGLDAIWKYVPLWQQCSDAEQDWSVQSGTAKIKCSCWQWFCGGSKTDSLGHMGFWMDFGCHAWRLENPEYRLGSRTRLAAGHVETSWQRFAGSLPTITWLINLSGKGS